MCPNMTWNTVPLGGHAHSHTNQLTAPLSQHLIEQARTTTGRRSVALSTLTLRWRRREMSQIWFGHSALRQNVLDEPIVGRLHHLKTELQANEETDKNVTQKAS